MDSERYETAVDQVEKALCERYRVASLDGVGALGAAVAAARQGDLGPLEAAMAGREMYRWGETAAAAMAIAHEALSGEPVPAAAAAAEPVEVPRRRVLSDLNVAELKELAAANDIAVPEGAKKADVFKLLKEAKVAVPQEATGDGSGEELPDFEAMSREDLEAFAAEHDVEVPEGTDEEALRQLLLDAPKEAAGDSE